MKCIKKKCSYCEEHQFNMSYLTCNLMNNGNIGFHKDNDMRCVIDKEIKDVESVLADLVVTSYKIKSLQ